jgi:Secretion system C-terminal sorting domain
VNYERYLYTYDSNGNETLYLIEMWDDADWVIYSRITYTHDSNENMTSYLLETWDGANWVNSWRETYTYDTNGNITSYLREDWDGTNWVNSIFNGLIRLTDATRNFYSFFGIKIEIYYKIITNVDEGNIIPDKFVLQQNYPNPFNPSTTISYSIPQSNLVQLNVYDILGSKIAVLVNKEQSVGNYKVEFNASNLTSGIYFYRLQSGNFADTKKLILLR